MKGVSKLNGRSDLRLAITVEMTVKLPNLLDHVCMPNMNPYCSCLHFHSRFQLDEEQEKLQLQIQWMRKKSFKCQILGLKTMIVVIRYSKTDQIGRSVICKTESVLGQSQICTLKTLKSYLKVKSHIEGPSFCHLNCACLTINQFVSILHSAL